VMEGDASFLKNLDPQQASAQLVDDQFVRRSIAQAGGMAAFGLPENSFTRQEIIAP